jgi:hypothetical protein
LENEKSVVFWGGLFDRCGFLNFLTFSAAAEGGAAVAEGRPLPDLDRQTRAIRAVLLERDPRGLR